MPRTTTDEHPSRQPLTELEGWLQAHRGQPLVVTLRDLGGWFFIRMCGVLEELIREDDLGNDYTLEFGLDTGQEIVIYADKIEDLRGCEEPATSGPGLTLEYHAGNISIEVGTL